MNIGFFFAAWRIPVCKFRNAINTKSQLVSDKLIINKFTGKYFRAYCAYISGQYF